MKHATNEDLLAFLSEVREVIKNTHERLSTKPTLPAVEEETLKIHSSLVKNENFFKSSSFAPAYLLVETCCTSVSITLPQTSIVCDYLTSLHSSLPTSHVFLSTSPVFLISRGK